jgi:putative hydrolase of the HAD superfamily
MGAQATPRAILLDALGTLVRLEPPAPRLRAAVLERFGIDVGTQAAEGAMRAEIAYYRSHMDTAGDADGLAALRLRCAEVVREALWLEASAEEVLPALLGALEFTPFDDVEPALQQLRGAGVRLVVVSNWDVSLHEVLARTGLDRCVDGALASAEVGAAKPDPAIFARALSVAAVEPADAWHVGDSWDADVEGAIAAGLRPVLLDRGAVADGEREGVKVVRSLAGLIPLYG